MSSSLIHTRATLVTSSAECLVGLAKMPERPLALSTLFAASTLSRSLEENTTSGSSWLLRMLYKRWCALDVKRASRKGPAINFDDELHRSGGSGRSSVNRGLVNLNERITHLHHGDQAREASLRGRVQYDK
eukprot:2298240-Amphidinium_carterae.2